MNVKDWEILKTLYDEKTITRTTSKLYMSQPALTYRMEQLEKEMDTQLFIRSTKGISFTSAGERLVVYAERMLIEYADIKKSMKSNEGAVSGTLRLGSSSVFTHSQLPPLLKEFNQIYPQVDLCLYTGLSNEILKQLSREEITVAIIRGNHVWKEADVYLQGEPLYLISSNPLSFEDLPKTPGIRYDTDPTMQYQINQWWQENFSVMPKLLMHTGNVYTCCQLVVAGLGWAIIPALRLPAQLDNLFVVELKNKQNQPYKRMTRLIYRHTAKKIDPANAFIRFICQKYNVEPIISYSSS